MISSPIERVLRRDRIVIIAALASVTALAWACMIWLAAQMNAMAALGWLGGKHLLGATYAVPH